MAVPSSLKLQGKLEKEEAGVRSKGERQAFHAPGEDRLRGVRLLLSLD